MTPSRYIKKKAVTVFVTAFFSWWFSNKVSEIQDGTLYVFRNLTYRPEISANGTYDIYKQKAHLSVSILRRLEAQSITN